MGSKYFEIVHRDGLARIGKLSTAHGTLTTPAILPVVNPNLRLITPSEMKSMGAEGIITNGYIIRRSPELREKAERSGLHSMLQFDGPIMTDSGTFQSYVYGDMEFDNRGMVEFQRKIGSDVVTILDIFSRPDFNRSEASDAVRETYRRLGEIEPSETSFLAGPIQGSLFPDLRRKSSRLMGYSHADYLPVGGVVPLLEQYRYADLVNIIWNVKRYGNKGKPLHLFGGGHPMFLALAVYLGIDLFDSASYAKYARDSRLLFPDGTRDLARIGDFPAWSPLHGRYTVKEVISADVEEKTLLLARHNLFAIFQELSEVRERIHEQNLWEYVQQKTHSHPSLHAALEQILRIQGGLEAFTELSRRSPYFHFQEHSRGSLFHRRIKRFAEKFVSQRETVRILDANYRHEGIREKIIEEYEKSSVAFMIPWNGIHVPLELEDTYPVQQVIGSGESNSTTWIRGVMRKYSLQPHDGEVGSKVRSFNLQKLRTIAEFQFGQGIKLFPDSTEIRVSRNTGRIRTASVDEKIMATLRASDGFLTLTMEGAQAMRASITPPRLSVVVSEESAGFNRKGYSVFFKFVDRFDQHLVAGNETLVLDPEEKLIAVGRSRVSGMEFGDYTRGVAVDVHHSVEGRDEDETD